jgi:hypothetical protein
MLAFKWYKVPTMLLEKVSIHTEILFVHCYNFFLLLLVLFLYLLKIVYYCLWDYKWICCVPVYCTCMVLIFYPFSQIVIISHKGTKKIFRYKNVASKSFYQSKIHFFSNANAKKWNVIHVYTVRNLINNLISMSYCSQLFQRNGCKNKIQYY